PKIKKITHQYNSCDNQVLAFNTGIFVRGQYWDTLLFMNAIDENRVSGNSLKKLYSEFVLQEEGSQDTYEDLFGKNLSFAFVPLDLAYVYGCKDSRMTYEVYEAQKKILSAPEYKKMLQHYIEVEAPQLEVVNKMQYRGVLLSDEIISSLHDEYTELINSLKS